MLCLMPKSNATTLNGFASLSAIAFFAAEENSHSAPVAPSDQTYGSEHVTSEMRSFPTIENAFALATSSSSGTQRDSPKQRDRRSVSAVENVNIVNIQSSIHCSPKSARTAPSHSPGLIPTFPMCGTVKTTNCPL